MTGPGCAGEIKEKEGISPDLRNSLDTLRITPAALDNNSEPSSSLMGEMTPSRRVQEVLDTG